VYSSNYVTFNLPYVNNSTRTENFKQAQIMIIKHEIAIRLQEARKKNKMSAVELSERTGFSKSRISNWENGRRTPGVDEAKILEDVLRIPATYLLCMNFEESNEPQYHLIAKDTFYKIPLFHGEDLVNGFPEEAKEWLPIPNQIERTLSVDIFAFSLADNSMADLFKKDDLVILDKKRSSIHGDFVLIKIHSSNSLLFRKIYFDNSNMEEQHIKFCALNNEWPEITASSNTQYSVLGVMRNKLAVYF